MRVSPTWRLLIHKRGFFVSGPARLGLSGGGDVVTKGLAGVSSGRAVVVCGRVFATRERNRRAGSEAGVAKVKAVKEAISLPVLMAGVGIAAVLVSVLVRAVGVRTSAVMALGREDRPNPVKGLAFTASAVGRVLAEVASRPCARRACYKDRRVCEVLGRASAFVEND